MGADKHGEDQKYLKTVLLSPGPAGPFLASTRGAQSWSCINNQLELLVILLLDTV